MTREEINQITGQVLDACMEVHRLLGPGLLESVYQFALMKELELRGLHAQSQVAVELTYKGYPTGKVYEIDLLVEGEVVVELKAVLEMHPVFDAQLLSYLKLANKRVGLLVNFHVPLLKDGFHRLVNNL